MCRKMMMTSMVIIACLSLNLSAKGAEAPKVTSWSNSKTGNQKTVFAVKPNEQITFSVNAKGAEKYVWMVDGEVQNRSNGASFKWTVPARKGMWKILVKTTTSAREQWVEKQVLIWNKLVKVTKDRRGKAFPEKKQTFIRGMKDHRLYPSKTRTEWIVATFLTVVKPGESIRKAVDSIPPEGGIVELMPGTHEITDEMYPPATFHFKRRGPVKYSIGIKRNNVTIYGSRQAVVRLHNNKVNNCFFIPDLEDTDPDLYVENITFRGFTVASTYKKGGRTGVIGATHVKNLTVEDLYDTSHARSLAGSGCSQGHHRYNSGVFLRNNTSLHGGDLGAMFSANVHIINNVLKGGTYAINVNRNNENWFVTGNHVTSGAHALHIHGPIKYVYIQGNTFIGRNPLHQDTAGAISNGIIEDNVFKNGKRFGISIGASCPLQNYTIMNNRIFNNGGHGIQVIFWRNEVAREINIINNVIYNNRGDGIRLDDHTQTLNVTNNIIANNKGYGINRMRGKMSLGHNNIWNNAAGKYNGCEPGRGDLSKDPLFANPSKRDFHLKSKAGRWDPKAKKWVKDDVTSPCIDAGDPKSDCSREPVPNGGRVNMGAYGNTPDASKNTSVKPAGRSG